MSTYTITTTAVQDAALKLLVADLNAQRPLPALTVQDYVVARLGDVLTGYADQYAGRILEVAAAVYPTLTAEQRGQILTALGRSSFVRLPLQDQLDVLTALAPADFRKLSPAGQETILQTLGLL